MNPRFDRGFVAIRSERIYLSRKMEPVALVDNALDELSKKMKMKRLKRDACATTSLQD